MGYIESSCRAGRTIDYRLYYSIRWNNGVPPIPKEEREGRKQPTSERQAAINRKNSLLNLTRTMNASFGVGDLYVTFSYGKSERPEDFEEFQSQAKGLLKRLRKLYKKHGLVFRYIWVAERGKQGGTHIHMVMSGIDGRKLRDVWPYGFITIKPLDPSGNYHRLAAYFIKYSDKTMRTENKLQGKRYNASKNLVHPKPEKTKIRKRRKFDPGAIKVPEGWYLDQDTVEHGVSDFTGYEYLSYTLVLLPGYEVVRGKAARIQKTE